jgi:hypothetical protein
VAAGSDDCHLKPPTADRDVRHAAKVVTFDCNDSRDVAVLVHDRLHATKIAESFFADIPGQKQIDRGNDSCFAEY